MIDKCVESALDKTDDFGKFTKEMEKLGNLVKDNYECLRKNGEKACDAILELFIKQKGDSKLTYENNKKYRFWR